MGRVKPGSRASRYLELCAAAVRRTGRGLTVPALRQAYNDTVGAPPPSLVSEVVSMAKRGVLVVAGGRVGHLEYAPAGTISSVPAPRADDDVERVCAALGAAHAALRRDVSTREVAESLETNGMALTRPYPNAVRRALLTLSRPRRRGPISHRRRVIAVPQRAPSGRPVMYWRPAHATPVLPPVAAPSRTEAIVAAVGECVSRLGRPILRTELAAWLRAEGGRRLGLPLDPSRLGVRLEDAVHDAANGCGTVLELRTRWTCHGGAAPRYAVDAPSTAALSIIALEDLVTTTRLADEMRSQRALAHRTRMLRSEPLGALLQDRQSLVRALLAEVGDFATITTAIEGALAALERRDEWSAIDDRRRRGPVPQRRWREHLDAARRCAPAVPYHARARVVGEAAGCLPDALAPWMQAAERSLGSAITLRSRLDSVRRVPVPPTMARSRAVGAGALLDRVDALEICYGATSLPWTWSLLEGALQVLGPVLRDQAYLSRWTATTPLASWERRVGVIALGLLGSEEVPAIGGAQAWRVAALAGVLGHGMGAAQWLDALANDEPGSRSGVQTLRARVAHGFVLGACE